MIALKVVNLANLLKVHDVAPTMLTSLKNLHGKDNAMIDMLGFVYMLHLCFVQLWLMTQTAEQLLLFPLSKVVGLVAWAKTV